MIQTIAAGDLEPLDEFFGESILSANPMPSDDFPRGTFYDYYLNGQWYGVPYNSDIRGLYYNPQTLSNFGVAAPPRGDDLGVSFTIAIFNSDQDGFPARITPCFLFRRLGVHHTRRHGRGRHS